MRFRKRGTANAKRTASFFPGVRLYPTVLILDPTGTVVFKGDIDEAERKLEALLK